MAAVVLLTSPVKLEIRPVPNLTVRVTQTRCTKRVVLDGTARNFSCITIAAKRRIEWRSTQREGEREKEGGRERERESCLGRALRVVLSFLARLSRMAVYWPIRAEPGFLSMHCVSQRSQGSTKITAAAAAAALQILWRKTHKSEEIRNLARPPPPPRSNEQSANALENPSTAAQLDSDSLS